MTAKTPTPKRQPLPIPPPPPELAEDDWGNILPDITDQETTEAPPPPPPPPPAPAVSTTNPGDPLWRGDTLDHARVGAAYRMPIVGSGTNADLHRESVQTPEARHRDYNFNTGTVVVYFPVGVPVAVLEAAKDPASKVVKLRD